MADRRFPPWRVEPTASQMRRFAAPASQFLEPIDASAALMGRIGCFHVTSRGSDVQRTEEEGRVGRLVYLTVVAVHLIRKK